MSSQTKPANQKSKTLWVILRRALALRETLYEDALSIPKAHRRGLTIVVLAALSHGLGGTVILLFSRPPFWFVLLAFGVNAASVIAGYYFWTFTIFKLGQWRKLQAPHYQDLLPPIGFAYAPQILNILTLIPLLGRPIQLVLAAWSWLAVTIAVRESLTISTPPAALMCLIGWPLIQLGIGSLQVLEQSWAQSLR